MMDISLTSIFPRTLRHFNMLLLILICGLVAAINANCDACIAGLCHSRNTIIQGHLVTDQLAIDRTHNILYTQLNYTLLTALYLDDAQELAQLVENKRTSGLAVDQDTQDLYTSQYGAIRKYKYKDDYKVERLTLGPQIADRLHYEDTLYMVSPDGKFAYLNKTTKTGDTSRLEGYAISNFVKVNTTTFFIANNDVYKYDWDNDIAELICKNEQIIAIDKYGDVYFSDLYQRIILKRDKITEKIEVYATFFYGSIKDFVFDKDNNIVFRDMNDSVSRWMPEDIECFNTTPRDICHLEYH